MLYRRPGTAFAHRGRASASGLALALACCFAATPVLAQAPAQADSADPAEAAKADSADIVVTGSRIKRDGFEAPTPTTIVGQADIEKTSPTNIADYVNTLPQFASTNTPSATSVTIGGGLGGANILNLRSLGATRTLTLLDGRRVVAAAVTGVVDVNLFPQSLVTRVDVVTGGASAAFGSDAVGGVVNFILDKKYEGLKGDIQGGITKYGDGFNGRVSLTYGTAFAEGRGHLILSGMALKQKIIRQQGTRSWYNGNKLVINPAWAAGNGQPYFLIGRHVGLSTATDGGLITAVAGGAPASLVGTDFNADGTTSRFTFGTRSGNNLQLDGTYVENAGRLSLLPGLDQHSLYGFSSFEANDSLTFFVEGQYGYSKAPYNGPTASQGTGLTNAPLTIRADNPYLPASIAAQMPAGSSFSLGRLNFDGLQSQPVNTRRTYRGVVGVDGKLGDGWTWGAYYQFGRTVIDNVVLNDPIPSRIVLAADAVRVTAANVGTSGLTIGSIACRSTLTAPTNGCVPTSVFGFGSLSSAALAYVTGVARQRIHITEQVGSAHINGTPFELWAGPVSFAAGVEARSEKMRGDEDPLSATNSFNFGNYHKLAGSYTVVEGFGELAVPLLRDLPFARLIDFNGALRVTHYSVSGTVATWKAGLNWKVNDDLSFRGTRSRDIRAPNLNDLYLGAQSNTTNVTDPVNGGASFSVISSTSGNTALKPEVANSIGAGVVIRPSWFPRFGLSVDYFNIRLRDAIATVTPQNAVNFCALGQTLYCDAITRNAANVITQIRTIPFNANSERENGLDIEMSYRAALSGIGLPGQLSARVFVTRVFNRTVTAGGTVQNLLNQYSMSNPLSVLKWKGLANLTYDVGVSSTAFTFRYLGAGVQDNTYVEGGNARLLSIDDNHVPAVVYVDATQTFDLSRVTGGKTALYFTVQNLFNKNPPIVPTANQSNNGVNGIFHDIIGRQYRIGARFDF